MISPTSSNSEAAREAARRPDGQFGTQQRGEADGVLLVDPDPDNRDWDDVHSAAESYASRINNCGAAEQVAFLRRWGVGDTEMLDAFEADPDYPQGALDNLVIDVCSHQASKAYNDGETSGDRVADALEGRRWMLTGSKTPVDVKHPMALKPGECTDMTIPVTMSDGTVEDIVYRVSYNEWTPNGDDNTPARDYRRGEFSAESEWAQHEYVVAEETSPFKTSQGGGMQRDYAWEHFGSRLRNGAVTSARARRNDPLRRWIEKAQEQ